MSSRNSSSWKAQVVTATLSALVLPTVSHSADAVRYSYLGASYEWTDVKYGVDPSEDPNFNQGSIEGFNLDASLALLRWLHIAGQYFDGDCKDCGTTDSGSRFDLDFSGYKVGAGVNLGLGLIGLKENTDLILRASLIEAELGNFDDDGYSAEAMLRAQVSDRAEVMIGIEYQDLDDPSNTSIVAGVAYEVLAGLTLTGNAVVFDNDAGLSLGLRWYFGDLVFGDRDSIF